MLGALGGDPEIGNQVAEIDPEEGQWNPMTQAVIQEQDADEVGIIIDAADDEGHDGSEDEYF
jgi:hypothetical protein